MLYTSAFRCTDRFVGFGQVGGRVQARLVFRWIHLNGLAAGALLLSVFATPTHTHTHEKHVKTKTIHGKRHGDEGIQMQQNANFENTFININNHISNVIVI